MKPAAFVTFIEQVKQQALTLKQRRLVVLAGESAWALSLLASLPEYSSASKENTEHSWHIYSDDPLIESNISKQNYRHKLGTECHNVVFADSAFNLDAFAALSGTIIFGGFLFLVVPADIAKFSKNSFFLQRLFQQIAANKQHFIIEEYKTQLLGLVDLQRNASKINAGEEGKPQLPLSCLTAEQFQAVQSIENVVTGHRDRPLVITADRGRGKSSALAIAASHLLLNASQQLRIVITAPQQQALVVFFKQVLISLPNAEFNAKKQTISHKMGVIEFIAIDQLLKNPLKITLLLVDEAAAIPVYLLQALLTYYHRIVFSSTVHGYEGAGRGFTLKFQKILSETKPQWRSIHLNEPIRWQQDCPLESFIFESCLLNAELDNLAKVSLDNIDDLHFTPKEEKLEVLQLSSEDLLGNETLLRQVFAVLVTAHYQTSPNDLRMLLDNQKITLLAIKQQGHILAVALLMLEGLCPDEDVRLITSNKRRLKDQFIPQSLLSHCGFKQAFEYSYLRVMRIAVHPEIQNKGIGSSLLHGIEQYGQSKNVDFIGTSFGVNRHLLNFWQLGGFSIARIGFSQDKASGEHSALMLKPLSQNTSEKNVIFYQQIITEFYRTFDYLLSRDFQSLPAQLVWQILHFSPTTSLPEINESDFTSVNDFSAQVRQFGPCAFGLHQWLLRHITHNFKPGVLPLISRIIQGQSVENVCFRYQFTGKKALNKHLVNYIKVNSDKC